MFQTKTVGPKDMNDLVQYKKKKSLVGYYVGKAEVQSK